MKKATVLVIKKLLSYIISITSTDMYWKKVMVKVRAGVCFDYKRHHLETLQYRFLEHVLLKAFM